MTIINQNLMQEENQGRLNSENIQLHMLGNSLAQHINRFPGYWSLLTFKPSQDISFINNRPI